MKLYNFTRLITKYKATFEIVSENNGHYEDGEWQPDDNTTITKQGAIVPMSEKKIYQPGGTYTTQDRELYMFEKLPDALLNSYVIYQGNRYKIEQETDYSEYSDVYTYVLRRVSAVD